MTDKDELLVSRFFSEQKQDISDSGFSRRVMRNLPLRGKIYSYVWTAICIVASIVLFIVLKGWDLLGNAFEVVLRTAPANDIFHYNPLVLLFSLSVLVCLGIYNVVASEDY